MKSCASVLRVVELRKTGTAGGASRSKDDARTSACVVYIAAGQNGWCHRSVSNYVVLRLCSTPIPVFAADKVMLVQDAIVRKDVISSLRYDQSGAQSNLPHSPDKKV